MFPIHGFSQVSFFFIPNSLPPLKAGGCILSMTCRFARNASNAFMLPLPSFYRRRMMGIMKKDDAPGLFAAFADRPLRIA